MLFRFPRLRKEALERERELSLISLDNCAIRLNGVLVFIRSKKKNQFFIQFNIRTRTNRLYFLSNSSIFSIIDPKFSWNGTWSICRIKCTERIAPFYEWATFWENFVVSSKKISRNVRLSNGDDRWNKCVHSEGGNRRILPTFLRDVSFSRLFFFGFENCYYKIEERRNNGISFHRLNPSTVEIQFIRAQEKGINDT